MFKWFVIRMIVVGFFNTRKVIRVSTRHAHPAQINYARKLNLMNRHFHIFVLFELLYLHVNLNMCS